MNYTLHQLIVFYKVCETKSITKAAEELFLTQPAVSIQLKNFQQQFDIPLTEVIGRQLYITDFGKEIALAAERIIHEVSRINDKTLAYQGQLYGKLKIGVVSTGKYVMPFFLESFLKTHKGIELYLDVSNKKKVIESLYSNEIDFALVSILPQDDQFQSTPLMENELYLVGNKNTPKIKKLSELNKTSFIYRELGSGTRITMEKFLQAENTSVQPTLELATNEAVKQAVIAGLGVSILPIIGIKNELLQNDLHIIPMKQLPIKSTWHLIWLKNKRLAPVGEKYLEYIQAQKQSIMEKHFSWTKNFKKV